MQRAKYLVGTVSWGNLAHLALSISVPLSVWLLVRLELVPIAVAVVLASKWRVLAVQPRHWLANIRANSSDLIVNFSFIVFLYQAQTVASNLLWVGLYISWLVYLKPQSRELMVGVQSLLTHFIGLTALFWLSDQIAEMVLVVIAWLIALSASRHYLSHFEEPLTRLISFGWAFVVAQLCWVLNRWLVIYPLSSDVVIPQPAIIVALIAYILGSLYHLSIHGKLRRVYLRQYIIIGSLILLVIVWQTDWRSLR